MDADRHIALLAFPSPVINRTLVVSHADVERFLPMAECIDLMAAALADLQRGNAMLPLRTVLRLDGGTNAFATMPAVLGDAIGAKIITVYPKNEGTPFESHIGVILYFESEHGRLQAIIDASSVTAIRTAAVSGLATRLLAREDSRTLAILGSGIQAQTHVDAMLAVRPLTALRVWSRTRANAERLAARARDRHGIHAEVCGTAREAVEQADVICTTTSAREPVLEGEWIRAGAHINAVGASVRTARELGTSVLQRSRLFVDRQESAMAEAGDILIPIAEEAIDVTHIAGELGDVVLGRYTGRQDATQITLFKSLGLAVEDVACARHIHARALAASAGTWIEIGGLR